jgi:hypothetical protein
MCTKYVHVVQIIDSLVTGVSLEYNHMNYL